MKVKKFEELGLIGNRLSFSAVAKGIRYRGITRAVRDLGAKRGGRVRISVKEQMNREKNLQNRFHVARLRAANFN